MTGTASIPGMGGMRAEVSGGLNLAQDYSHGHGLDGAMDRSSRGTAATAANTTKATGAEGTKAEAAR